MYSDSTAFAACLELSLDFLEPRAEAVLESSKHLDVAPTLSASQYRHEEVVQLESLTGHSVILIHNKHQWNLEIVEVENFELVLRGLSFFRSNLETDVLLEELCLLLLVLGHRVYHAVICAKQLLSQEPLLCSI